MVNIDLLDRALAAIDANPDSWDQARWGIKTNCGTAHCLAGWVAVLSGAEPIWEPFDEDGGCEAWDVRLPGGSRVDISRHAAKLLGLDVYRALELFAGNNNRADLQAMRDLLARNPQAGWRDLYRLHHDWHEMSAGAS